MPIATFSLVALDCDDPDELARFYSAVTGWPVEVPAGDDPVVGGGRWLQLLNGGGPTIAFQEIDDYVAPTWPGGEHPSQLHLDFDVPDLDVGEAAVVAIGARLAADQPEPDEFRVYLDPAGHPFCLVKAAG